MHYWSINYFALFLFKKSFRTSDMVWFNIFVTRNILYKMNLPLSEMASVTKKLRHCDSVPYIFIFTYFMIEKFNVCHHMEWQVKVTWHTAKYGDPY